MIKTAKPEDATGTFKKCAGCHSYERGCATRSGPDLWGLVGRPKASAAGFSYSEGMKSKGGEWSLRRSGAIHPQPQDLRAGHQDAVYGRHRSDGPRQLDRLSPYAVGSASASAVGAALPFDRAYFCGPVEPRRDRSASCRCLIQEPREGC